MKQKTKDNIILLLYCLLCGLLFACGVLYGNYNNDIKYNSILSDYNNHLKNYNLNLYDKCIGNKCKSDTNLNEWNNYINSVYILDYEYNYKFWNLNWCMYLEKHSIEYEIIQLYNLDIIFMYDKTKYCIISLNNLTCYDYV